MQDNVQQAIADYDARVDAVITDLAKVSVQLHDLVEARAELANRLANTAGAGALALNLFSVARLNALVDHTIKAHREITSPPPPRKSMRLWVDPKTGKRRVVSPEELAKLESENREFSLADLLARVAPGAGRPKR